MDSWLRPVQLEGELVKLVPLQKTHKVDLAFAASDGKLWELWYTAVPSPKTIDTYIETALSEQASGKALPFAIINKKTNTIVGTTRYLNVDAKNKRVEIGATWYSKKVQRTGINTECKYILLKYAFENLNCIAVEFRTHFHNHPSRNAILRLGAKQDGILRNHRVDEHGNLRDTVVFSILDSEWKTVKTSLEFKMTRSYLG
ncbi:MAG TPA: GNAT family N-acetyltransferase [Muricauda sp.]|uniref:GNAT family N-acetyltransferase n=1 Tax=Flagellimonas aurea TaxID=2915619 RepID=A0ABS3G7X9_9FLAO|nr:GNAT family protein [Allomuricauda aurea]MAO16219.1 GNAT family N-acetyltransferase [Allomuricauda sp.]MBO0355518.1 GNAT family N-acetyltransferase [Allomuricauda aurea]UBZ12320.1 GNAT family N-acetyltransferase [Allomuricauda aquimarina]HBU77286.1 GNAT family N-acetyltransferase [Allomuricauda sp.]|tara:strand:- start:353 stop:955 length:603 start_codon:yes stop_codon:yes gene_type:complete